MSYQIADFSSEIKITAGIHHAYPNVATELAAIATALGSDTSTHDTTITTAPAGLIPGVPGQSRFTNDVLLIVNAGKAGNLSPAAMAAAITAGIPVDTPPANTTPPAVAGTGTVGQNLTVTPGVWTNSPTEILEQWQRAGVPIPGATGLQYALVGADSGNSIDVRETATNAAGSTSADSNAIAVA